MDKRLVVLLVTLLVLAGVPAPVAAEETRTGGTIVVEEGETVDEDLTVFGGTVIVRGTVNGDLTAFTGNVFVDGRVNGDLEAFAANVRINGTVTGDANTAGANVVLAQGARVGGQLVAGASNAIVEGEVGGDVRIGAETITVGPSAVVGGDLAYDGDLTLAEGARIEGQVRQEDDLGVGFRGPVVPNWFGWVYGFLGNLLLGALVLLVFPVFSANLSARAIETPLRAGGVGLLAFVGIPLLAVLFFITIVGIPLGLLVILLYPLALWLGFVYGSFAVGTWLLDFTDAENRWLAFFVGLLATSVVGFVPILGALVQFGVLLLGLGALALGGRNRYRGRRATRAESGPETTA